MCVSGSALLKRLIRSLVNPAAMPDHSVSCCGCGAAAPDEQAAEHSEASNAAIANGRGTSLADAIANLTAPSSGKRSRIIRELNRFPGAVTIDDKSSGCSRGAATDNAR